MEQVNENHVSEAGRGVSVPAAVIPASRGSSDGGSRLVPASADCPTCADGAAGGVAASFVYAVGRVQARIPSLGVEKEIAQVIGSTNTGGLTDTQALYNVLKSHRYLARQLCYSFTVEGIETYLLQPADPGELDMLVEAIRPAPKPSDIDVIIGTRGPMAPPEMCNGLVAPIVVVEQVYQFDIDGLIKSIPRPKDVPEQQFHDSSEALFNRLAQLADNSGATDEHRALNYLSVRYPVIYQQTAECFGKQHALSAVEVRHSRLSGTRKIVDVVFTFTHRQTDVPDRYFVRVDVTEMFPFLVSKLQHYYDR